MVLGWVVCSLVLDVWVSAGGSCLGVLAWVKDDLI